MPEKQPSHAYMVANPTKDWTSCAIGSSVRVSTSIAPVQVHTLPPTSAAAKNRSARVYYQVQEWMGHRALDPQAAMGMDSGRGPTRPHNNGLTCCTGVPAKNCSLQLQNRLQLTQMYTQKDGTGVFCSLW